MDITMSDAHEPSYPAPESTPSTPYPTLSNNDDGTVQRRSSLPTGTLFPATASASPSMAETARGYLTLSQYFQIGRDQSQVTQPNSPDTPEDDEGDAEEDEDEAGDDGGEGEDAQQPPRLAITDGVMDPSLSTPATPAQEDVWTSLPGVHHLPDDDYLEARTPNAWVAPPAPTPVVDREINQRRGRGRGRGAGRRSWKWALKGTEHADMFQSPKITAEASGTKRRGRGGRVRSKGPRGRPGRNTAARQVPRSDPGEEFKALQAQATTAFLDNDLDAALEYALQAVTKNPEVSAAHFLIDQVLTAQGRHQEAFQSHWMAVVTSRSAEAWMAHGERLLDLAGDDKTDHDYDAAFRCFSEALKLDKNNVEIRSKKVDLFIDMKAYRSAFRECRTYMKLQPGDTDMLWKLAEILKLAKDKIETKMGREDRDLRVVEAYTAAFHEWRGEAAFGDADMQWAHLDMYVGLLEDVGTPPGDCVRELKQLARWFLGRGHEIFWDSLDDDREYDLTPERRIGTNFWMNRMFTLDEARYGNGLPLWLRAKLACLRARMGPQYRDEALRHLDVLLLRPGAAEDNPETFMVTAERLSAMYWYQDAVKLYEAARDQDHPEASRFFLGMAKCYRMLGRSIDAEHAYKLASSADPENLDPRIELARLYAEAGKKDEAAEVAHAISQLGRESIQRSEKALLAQRLMRHTLAPTLRPANQVASQNSRSHLVLQHLPGQGSGLDPEESFPRSRDKTTDDAAADEANDDDETESLPASIREGLSLLPKQRKAGKITNQEQVQSLRDQRTRVQQSYAVIKKLWPLIDAGSKDNEDAVRQWVEQAELLAKEFTSMKVFYGTAQSERFAGLLAGRNAETRRLITEMDSLRRQMRAANLESTHEPDAVPSADDKTSGDFHEISFQEWHHILADLALQYVRLVDQESCNRMLDALTRANVFRHDFGLYNTTLALSIYCAIVFNDRELFVESSRQYLYQSDYRSGMAHQIYAAAASIGYGDSPFDTDSSKMQQWTQRMVKAQDLLIMDPEMREMWEWGVVELQGKEARHNRIGKVEDGLIPGLLTTYAHIVTSKQRVHSATSLSYLFRALALRPDDVVVNLSIATNCIADALRRAKFEGTGLDRQRLIQQGLSFFYRYYNARVANGRKCYLQEAEYNAARIWDLLGWTHLAAKGYEKVLKLSLEVREEAERKCEGVQDLANEAAFALQKIFVAADNEDAARAIGEQWLVV